MKIIKFSIRFIFSIFKFIFGLLIILAFFQYLVAPTYTFPKKKKFSGPVIYNPYQSCDSLQWKKGVFHVHTHSWGGVTNGASSSDEVFKRYQFLGYDIVALSDYQKINPAKYPRQKEYIPNYEHGFGVKKNHHLSVGATGVVPFDFLYPQTSSNKQLLINLLRPNTPLLALAHPDWNHAVTANDIKKLCSYDCFEIASTYHHSVALWDSALSAGVPAFLLCDDDGHNIENPNIVGRFLTMVNVEQTIKDEVVSALKLGKSIGVEVNHIENESWEIKKQNIASIPTLLFCKNFNDTVRIKFSEKTDTILCIGQHGKVLQSFFGNDSIQYVCRPEDSYVRFQIKFPSGCIFYMNPLLRYDGKKLPEYKAEINYPITVLKNLIFVLTILVIVKWTVKRRKQRKATQ